jgi:hypothetical protein
MKPKLHKRKEVKCQCCGGVGSSRSIYDDGAAGGSHCPHCPLSNPSEDNPMHGTIGNIEPKITGSQGQVLKDKPPEEDWAKKFFKLHCKTDSDEKLKSFIRKLLTKAKEEERRRVVEVVEKMKIEHQIMKPTYPTIPMYQSTREMAHNITCEVCTYLDKLKAKLSIKEK